MSISVPSGGLAVMQNRRTGLDSLDLFATPPWSTRALCEHILGPVSGCTVWEPAAGLGHMAEVLAEYFSLVIASDVHDYGRGHLIGSFVGEGADVVTLGELPEQPHWIITNPPFNLALEFAERAINLARRGAALLVRSTWLEGGERYRRLFSVHPPHTVAVFSERVPMVKGRWDPTASTATAYAWIVWRKSAAKDFQTRLVWIPPGCRTSLTRPDDVARFAA